MRFQFIADAVHLYSEKASGPIFSWPTDAWSGRSGTNLWQRLVIVAKTTSSEFDGNLGFATSLNAKEPEKDFAAEYECSKKNSLQAFLFCFTCFSFAK